MNRLGWLVALGMSLALAACGSDKTENLLLETVTGRAKAVLLPKKAAVAAPAALPSRAELQKFGAPVALIAVPTAGAITLMGQVSTNGGTESFASPDGSMVTYLDGVLISTRGIPGGLMSASVPSPVALARAGSSHTRVHYVLGDNDSIAPISFTCTTALVGTEVLDVVQKRHTLRHMTETCEGAAGQITNHYWFEGTSRIRVSRQWVTPALQYFETQYVID